MYKFANEYSTNYKFIMKKNYLKTIATFAMMAFVAVSMVSCGSDDDNDSGKDSGGDDQRVTITAYEFDVTFENKGVETNDYGISFPLMLAYYDAEGKMNTERVEQGKTVKKTIVYDRKNNFGMCLVRLVKPENPQAIQNVPDSVEFVVGMAVSGKVTTKYSNNTSEVADAQYIFGGTPISKITGEKLKKSYASRNYLGYYCYYANDETAGSGFLFNEDFVKALGIEYAKDK